MKYLVTCIVLVIVVLIFNEKFRPFEGCRITAYESCAAATMKSAIFSSQVQMQMGTYLDVDGNCVGEYGFIEQLNGRESILPADGKVIHESVKVMFLTGPLSEEIGRNGYGESNKYYFKMFLPDGRGGMYDYDAYSRDPDKKRGTSLREKHYLILAWPTKSNESSRRIFAMMEDGQLRSPSSVEVRSAFMESPDWRHLFKGRKGTFEEILKQGPSDDWPYYSK